MIGPNFAEMSEAAFKYVEEVLGSDACLRDVGYSSRDDVRWTGVMVHADYGVDPRDPASNDLDDLLQTDADTDLGVVRNLLYDRVKKELCARRFREARRICELCSIRVIGFAFDRQSLSRELTIIYHSRGPFEHLTAVEYTAAEGSGLLVGFEQEY